MTHPCMRHDSFITQGTHRECRSPANSLCMSYVANNSLCMSYVADTGQSCHDLFSCHDLLRKHSTASSRVNNTPVPIHVQTRYESVMLRYSYCKQHGASANNMVRLQIRHATIMNVSFSHVHESCHTCQRVMSHM